MTFQEREKEKAKAEAEKKAKEGDRLKKAADMQAKMQQKLLNKQNKGRKVDKTSGVFLNNISKVFTLLAA